MQKEALVFGMWQIHKNLNFRSKKIPQIYFMKKKTDSAKLLHKKL